MITRHDIKEKEYIIRPGSTNQSIGNQIEKFFVRSIMNIEAEYTIENCAGQGYPDRALVRHSPELRLPLELKATAKWNPCDSNRRVLTSSSVKLRRRFKPPIHHVLLTLLYSNANDIAHIDSIRLDFLEPTTLVNVRLEASVSHKLLSEGDHYSVVI